MFATVDNTKYRVSFCYPTDDQGRRMTACEVYRYVDAISEDLVSVGRVTCSKQDNFNRVVGRKLALTKALEPLDKGIRGKIWEVYKNTCRYID